MGLNVAGMGIAKVITEMIQNMMEPNKILAKITSSN